MKICPECLNVYGASHANYCSVDGIQLVDSASEEAQPLIEKIKKSLEGEDV